MTKKELVEYLEDVPNNAIITVQDLYEYGFSINREVRGIVVRYGEYTKSGNVKSDNLVILRIDE